MVFGEEWSTGYVDIDTDFSGCDQRNSTVKVLITNLDRPSELGQFKIPKAAFSARRSAIVLGFDILPHADGSLQYYLIGSGIHLNEQNYINIPIYEIEMLAVCNHGRIELVIHHDERESTHIDVTREFFLENDAFNINMANETNNCTIINHSIRCKQFNHQANRIVSNGHRT
uniref:Integrin_alpha2 domain-containing protein n=1 Tax=Globodera pallida TaxID=36090 RepID=A0A183CHC2_GLOPA